MTRLSKRDGMVYTALKALVSSLAPQDAEKMSDAQVDVAASRLDQIFGNIEGAQDRQRNEKGEVSCVKILRLNFK